MNAFTRCLLFGACLMLSALHLDAQQARIRYEVLYNGKLQSASPSRVMRCDLRAASMTGTQGKVQAFLDYQNREVLQRLVLPSGIVTLKTSFDSLNPPTLRPDTCQILGLLCHKAILNLRSNRITVWYTQSTRFRGSPWPEVAPALGLILKIDENGTYTIQATSLDSTESQLTPGVLPSAWGREVDNAQFQGLLIQSRYSTIPVFTDQTINFGDSLHQPSFDQSDVVYRYAGGTVILKKVHFPDTLSAHVFVELHQFSAGDAYDRTGSVFLISPKDHPNFSDALRYGIQAVPGFRSSDSVWYRGMISMGTYVPALELMRFFTPFGIGYYSRKVHISGYPWKDSVTYRQDISDLAPALRGDVWIGVYLGNYDKNGHRISLQFQLYPGSTVTHQAHPWIRPLFNTVNLMEMAGQPYARFFQTDTLNVPFYVPDSSRNLTLRLISTGHGGWDGGDEFNKRLNQIFIDGKRWSSFIPWRTDCGTYRLDNPASGNFSDGLSSSDLSRSGWCPGSAAYPIYISLKNVKPGWHTCSLAIPEGAPDGNSFSFWNVSACLEANEYNL